MTEATAYICAVCGRAWVEGMGPGLETAPECGHGAEVPLPEWLRDQGDALRFLAERQALLKRVR